MADVADVVAPAIDQQGNTVIWWTTATIANLAAPGKVAVMDAATTFRITHDFTPDGFPVDSSQEKTTDERLALIDELEALGKVQTNFGDGIVYVDTQAVAGRATIVLSTGSNPSITGYFIVRRNIPNSTLAAASQKVTVYPVTLGPQRRGPITGSGKFTWKQQVVLSGPPVEATLAA